MEDSHEAKSKGNWLPIVPVTVLLALPFYYETLGNAFFKILAPVTQYGAHHLLRFLGKDTQVGGSGYWTLVTKDLKVAQCIGPTGLGIAGIVAFLCVFSFFLLKDRKRLSAPTWAITLWVGIGFMFFLNIARVSASFLISCRLHELTSDPSLANDRTKSIVANLSPPLYALGIGLFFFFLFKNKKNTLYSHMTGVES